VTLRGDGECTHTPWFDLNCSGEDKDSPLCHGRTGRMTVMATLGSRSSVLFDLDNDGDLDLVTNDFNSEPQVPVSDLAQRKPICWLKIVLVEQPRTGTGLARRCACARKGKSTPNITTASQAICRKALCRFTSAWRMRRASIASRSIGPPAVIQEAQNCRFSDRVFRQFASERGARLLQQGTVRSRAFVPPR
jgi:hypothetical protein